MKGLLHSKRFRTNLYKWLFMYVGVMMLLITVITYSKYISSLGGKDESRPTKFNVTVDTLNCTDEACGSGAFRPTSNIEYYFSLDTTELEVNTFLVVDIWIDPDFEVVKLETVNLNSKKLTPIEEIEYNVVEDKIRMTGMVMAARGQKTGYKLTVKYKDGSEGSIPDPRSIIKISYSATQKN